MNIRKMVVGALVVAPILWLAVTAPVATIAIALVNLVIHSRMPKDRPMAGKLVCLLLANSMLCMFAAPMGAVYGTLAGMVAGAAAFSVATGMDWNKMPAWIDKECDRREYKGTVEILDDRTGEWRRYDANRHEWA